MSSWPLEIQVGEKKIVIDSAVHSVLREYVKTGMGIDELAEKLGLDTWSEAYELLKQVPAWIYWIPPSVYEESLKRPTSQVQQKSAESQGEEPEVEGKKKGGKASKEQTEQKETSKRRKKKIEGTEASAPKKDQGEGAQAVGGGTPSVLG
ncbi:MAG: hypothetical protein ACP5UI_01135 [Thermoprotei archaeon]